MDLSSEKTFKIIEFVLGNRVFGQRKASRELSVSVGQVNKVVKWLELKNFIGREKNAFKVLDVAGIISAISFFRHMQQLRVLSIPLRMDKKQAMKLLPKDVVLCLESALDFYSPHYVSNRVCIYAGEKSIKKITEAFYGHEGNQTHLFVFKPMPSVKPVKMKGFMLTSKVRTVIDLVCDDKAFAADPLFKQLWGVKFG